MVKTIDESLGNVAEVITQDHKLYSLGQVFREIVDLKFAGRLEMGKSGEERQALVTTLENRMKVLYAELDRREKFYVGWPAPVFAQNNDGK